jgi:hypothetical protein
MAKENTPSPGIRGPKKTKAKKVRKTMKYQFEQHMGYLYISSKSEDGG